MASRAERFLTTAHIARIGPVAALVDTGACASFIMESVLPPAFLEKVKGWDAEPIQGFGLRINPTGIVALTVREGADVVDLKRVGVVKSLPYPMLLGSDFLDRVGGYICCKTGQRIGKCCECNRPANSETGLGEAETQHLNVIDGKSNKDVVGAAVCCATGGRIGHLHGKNQRVRVDLTRDERVPAYATRFLPFHTGLGDGTEFFVSPTIHEQPLREWAVPGSVLRAERGIVRIPLTTCSDKKLRLRIGEIRLRGFLLNGGENIDCASGGVVATVTAGDFKGNGRGAIEEARFGENLSTTELESLKSLLGKHRNCFERTELPSAPQSFEMKVDTGLSKPISHPPRRYSRAEGEIISKEVGEMLKAGVIEPSNGPWSSPVVLVKKKDGSIRFCVDYRKLNDCTIKDVYPLPRVSDILDSLAGSKLYASLDLYRGFWQVPLAKEDRQKTSFICPDGLFQFKRMGFGLCNGPSAFQRMMDQILGSLKWLICLVYLDDVLVGPSMSY